MIRIFSFPERFDCVIRGILILRSMEPQNGDAGRGIMTWCSRDMVYASAGLGTLLSIS